MKSKLYSRIEELKNKVVKNEPLATKSRGGRSQNDVVMTLLRADTVAARKLKAAVRVEGPGAGGACAL